jgi:hypothetical protein
MKSKTQLTYHLSLSFCFTSAITTLSSRSIVRTEQKRVDLERDNVFPVVKDVQQKMFFGSSI